MKTWWFVAPLTALWFFTGNTVSSTVRGNDILKCPSGWQQDDINCYRFFNIRHSWRKASEICRRYGGELVLIENYSQNNFTSRVAALGLRETGLQSYWIGLTSVDSLSTNTLESASGSFVSKYTGFWDHVQPRPQDGECVRAKLKETAQVWEMAPCETLLPFICHIHACHRDSFHCNNGQCVSKKFLCDGEDDCGDQSDEMDCPASCHFHLQSAGDAIQSPNYPNRYFANSNCKWTLEGPIGTGIVLQFSDFDTEASFDTVQIQVGGRTEEKSVSLVTLSGSEDLSSMSYTTASNLMIIKFRSDASVEKKGFRASWKTEPLYCGGELFAQPSAQVLTSATYPQPYPGGLECLYVLTAPPGKILTLEIIDIDLERNKDYILVRDGARPSDPLLAKLTGGIDDNPKFLISSANRAYVYFHSSFGDSRRGFAIRFRAGCDVEQVALSGNVSSPAYGISNYPTNQICIYKLRLPGGGPVSLKFDEFNVAADDFVQVFDGTSHDSGIPLHPGTGFTGVSLPSITLTSTSGSLVIVFTSNPVNIARGWKASFSADCPAVHVGNGAIASSRERTFRAKVRYTCPVGQEFSTGEIYIETECMESGQWSIAHIPKCKERYCGPVPQTDNGFAVASTNVTYRGTATYQCYAGFAFLSGMPTETIRCTADGTWEKVPLCLASSCSPLPETPHATQTVLNGGGRSYGTVIRFECEPGYYRTGDPVILCMSDGQWSSPPPRCERAQCPTIPSIEHGFIAETQRVYYFQDFAKVQCHRGYRLEGNPVITCGPDQNFSTSPTCVDVNECSASACDAASTTCTNTAGGFFCKCKTGFQPNYDCRPVGDLGLTSGVIPDTSIKVSGVEAGYNKNMVRLDGSVGWCGNIPRAGHNWVQIDLRAPTVVRGLKLQPVIRSDGSQAFPVNLRLHFTDNLTDVFRVYSDSLGRPIQFLPTLDQRTGMSTLTLQHPLEARYIRVVIMEYIVAPCMRIELMGCTRQDCLDDNECLEKNGGCDQRCINSPGSFNCLCNAGFDLYTANGTAGFNVPRSETGLKDDDVYTINKTCVPKMCPSLNPPENGIILSTKTSYHFGDRVSFHCDFAFVMVGSPTLLCTSTGTWNGTAPSCEYAHCDMLEDDPSQGLLFDSDTDGKSVPFFENVTVSCNEVGRPLRMTATSYFRQCVFDPQEGRPAHWLAGARPSCPRVDCGPPPETPGSTYGFYADTRYKASFFFGCEETYTLAGKSSLNDNIIRCQEDGTWDFGDLRCEGPVCEDPGRPPDGDQLSLTYEQGSETYFSCSRPGYEPYTSEPITCNKNAECKVIKPIGIASGTIPDSAMNATSQRQNYEAKHARLNSATGWCGKNEPFIYITVDLGRIYIIKTILVKGVITNDVIGRPTELRFFYKVKEAENFVVYFPNFNLTTREENFGELTVISLPLSVRARFVILGIVAYSRNPCLKFELMGCEETKENILLGYDAGYPLCVDKEPPQFLNCPSQPIIVTKSVNGIHPVNFSVPEAVDNSGHIARFEILPKGFTVPALVVEDTTVQYTAYDSEGNIASCTVNIVVPDYTPPYLSCPQSYVVELVEKQESYQVNFNDTRRLINVTDVSSPVIVILHPETAIIPLGGFRNVTVVASDRFNNQAMCHFQVSVQASSCVSWSLEPPVNGVVNCLPNEESNGFRCLATCNTGFRFTDGQQAKTFTCAAGQQWLPGTIVPDCVPEDTNQAAYDVMAMVDYEAPDTAPSQCVGHYISSLAAHYRSLNQVLSERCSAINVKMDLTIHNTSIKVKTDGEVTISYTVRIDPVVRQTLLYDLCGSTLGLIFDLSVPSTSAIIEPLLNVTVRDVQGCPSLQAIRSSVTRGFACEVGEVLNTPGENQVPRCLHCPAGTYASSSEVCSFCSRGFYQDLTRQGSCKKCPDGMYTKQEGSKSLQDCIPVCGYGTYSPSGLVPCLQCPSNTFSAAPPRDGFKECQRCPANTFTYSPGATAFTDCRAKCPPGTHSDTGLEPCSPCPTNYYQPLEGQTTCQECPPKHRTLRPGALSPEACTPVPCGAQACQNGGICVVQIHQPKCVCPAGFSGQFCEVDIDECASRPCYNGASCIDHPQGYTCICPTGYRGLQCQLEQNECHNGSCPERAMCQDMPGLGTVNCLCRIGYEGTACNVTINPCTSGEEDPCENGATCIPLQQGRYKCICPPGLTGPTCDTDIDDCAENPCLLGANCTDLLNDFSCDCPPGFGGKRCQMKYNLCAFDPCHRGTCVDYLFYYSCICDPGWTGPTCDINIDDCASKPCQNGGECFDLVDGFRCHCDTGFTGSKCQHAIDACEASPCQNGGTCFDLINGFACQCRPGYVGLQCEAEVDECISNPCHSSGTETCIDLDNTFQCVCNPGFRGEHCEFNINECMSNPCLNNGICTDIVNGFRCQCPQGWTGERCEFDLGACDSDPCLNDAKCIDLFQDYFCVCPSGTDGKRCQTSPERCIGSPCMHGGVCNDYGSGLNCSCLPEYTGLGCQLDFNPCQHDACQNGATCEDRGDYFKCICAPGFTGTNCESDVPDCTPISCPPTATCIDLTNSFYCKCPFNFTGEDCRKPISIDYDLYINDESRSSSVSLAAPFDLGTSSITVAMWIQYNNHEASGTFFTMYSVESLHLPVGKKVLIQADQSGVLVSLFSDAIPDTFIPYLKNVPINDGQWHHIVVIWNGATGTVMLITDTAVAGTVTGYAQGAYLPEHAWLNLGSPLDDQNKAKTGAGFHGRISRVNIWDRPLDVNYEIPTQFRSCKSAPVVFNGLLLRWTGYDRVDGTVEREGPGSCGEYVCPVGYTGDSCSTQIQDKTPPKNIECPNDIWIVTPNSTTRASWKEPVFADALQTLYVAEHKGLTPGQILSRGIHQLSYVAKDAEGNTAKCDFRVHILKEFCPLPPPPTNGQRHCSDWGPNGRFKVCTISCDPGLEFSQPVAKFYTCGAEGIWHPRSGPGNTLVFPTCAARRPAQKIFRIGLNFPSSVVCSESGKKILRSRIEGNVVHLNREWRICTDPVPGTCSGLKVSVWCNKQGIIKRQLHTDEFYVVEISFPANNDPVININTQQQSTIRKVLESAILQNSAFDIKDTLPNVVPDLTSLDMVTDYSCLPGQVVVAPYCVECGLGTYYDNATQRCLSCPVGTFQDGTGHLTCKLCPFVNEKQGITPSLGARSAEECKERCTPGKYFDDVASTCKPCGYGFYQPNNGSFSCIPCGPDLTTKSNEAISIQECREECAAGYQLSKDGGCEPCMRGFYRPKGAPSCIKCPVHRTTPSIGSKSEAECSEELCSPGYFMDSSKRCVPCPKGTYMDREQQETECKPCPSDTTTVERGSTSSANCTNPCYVNGQMRMCQANAFCVLREDTDSFTCECQPKYRLENRTGECVSVCDSYCLNGGTCEVNPETHEPNCHCATNFHGVRCGNKAEFVYIAGGIAGAVIFIIILVLLIWMICVRSSRKNKPKKMPEPPLDLTGSQTNFYYGAPAPYAESIAPSHHSTYAHYYDDDDDGWEMPNFYNETYMKDSLHHGKGNSLARSTASIYGNKEDLYDRLRRHQYQGKKDSDSEDQG